MTLFLDNKRAIFTRNHGRHQRQQAAEGVEIKVATLISLSLELLFFAIGFQFNCDIFILITFLAFALLIIVRDPKFFVEMFYYIVSIIWNVVGVFCCDKGLVLEELSLVSYYSNALAPIAIFWTLFLGILYQSSLKHRRKIDSSEEVANNNKPLTYVLLVAVLIEVVVFSQVFSNPYFLRGVNRFQYLAQFMPSWVNSLKSHLYVFVPIAVMLFFNKKKLLPIIYFSLLVLIYVWVGDKFGTYFFSFYIFILAISPRVDSKKSRTAIIYIGTVLIALVIYVFVQNSILKGYAISDNLDYLSERLAQQGQIWWSVYTQISEGLTPVGSYLQDIASSISSDPTAYMNSGQWKMMDVAAHSSELVQKRIATKVPFSATTTATMFYYFSWPGCIMFFTVIAILYAKFIYSMIKMFQERRILESIIMVELLSMIHAFLGASNFAVFLSFKFALLLVALVVLHLWHKKHIAHLPKHTANPGGKNEKN